MNVLQEKLNSINDKQSSIKGQKDQELSVSDDYDDDTNPARKYG